MHTKLDFRIIKYLIIDNKNNNIQLKSNYYYTEILIHKELLVEKIQNQLLLKLILP